MIRRVVFAALLLTVWLSVPVMAQSTPTLTLDPSSIEVGETTQAIGAGFDPGSMVVYLSTVTGTALAKGTHAGSFNLRLEVSGLAAGTYRIIACNDQARNGECRQAATATLTIDEGRTSLTFTTGSTVVATNTSGFTLRTTTTERSLTSGTPTTEGATVTDTTIRPSDEVTTASTGTISTTGVDDLSGDSSSSTVGTIDPNLGISTSVGPDPTFDPNPSDLGQPTTTAGPYFTPGDTEFPDLFVTHIEVSQGIQNMFSKMPLVADRTTWVRVYVDNEGFDNWANVDGLLVLQRGGLPDKHLVPSNGPIVTKRPRTDIDSSLNFEIPDAYLDDGQLTIWAGVWSFNPNTVADEEPDPDNNIMSLSVEFHEADVPTIWLVALDDGGGPGPVVNNLFPLLGFAQVVHQDLLDYHPTATVNYQLYPEPVAPGPEALEPGLWDLGLDQDNDDDDTPAEETSGSRRHEPNIRMSWLLQDMLEDDDVLGWVDPSIPTGGYSGWAGYGVAWTKPSAGTPAHEFGHSRGLNHVACKDDDDNGVPDELKGGAIDPAHPTGLPPNCSLAPISPTGYYGLTTEQSSLTVYSNDPTDPAAAFPFMSYKSPGWTDPYHWCLLLEGVGVPCSPAVIGVPPKILQPAADCDPEPLPGGFGLDLCLAHQLPPSEPFGGGVDGVPWGGPVEYGFETVCGNAIYMHLQAVEGDVQSSAVDCGAATDAGGIVLERGYTADLDMFVPIDPESWIVVSGYANLTTGEAEIQQAARRDTIPAWLEQRYHDSIVGAASGATPLDLSVVVGQPVNQLPAERAEIDPQLFDWGTIAAVPLEVYGSGHGDGSEQGSTVGFVQAVPVPSACSDCFIQLKGIEGESKARTISPEPPVITSVEVFDAGDATLIEWSADDPDGGSQPVFDVLWSDPAGGWLHVATATSETSILVPHDARFPGGDDLRIRVVANDGVNTGEAESAPFSAPTHAPLLFTTGIPESGTSEQYETLLFQVHMLDPESGLPEASSVQWTSSIDGPLGDGLLLRTRDLSVGSHTIEVRAADADGNQAGDQFELEITPRVNPTRYLEVPDETAIALMADGQDGSVSDSGGFGEDEGALAAAASAASGLIGGWLGLIALVGAVGLAGVGGGWFLSRRRLS